MIVFGVFLGGLPFKFATLSVVLSERLMTKHLPITLLKEIVPTIDVNHAVFEDGLPLVFHSLNLKGQLCTMNGEAKEAHFVVYTENNVNIGLIVPFSIIIEFTLAIIQVRID